MPTADRARLGKHGEDLACREFRRRGYAILARGYRIRYVEIDIVALDGAVLVFVEVKTQREPSRADVLAADLGDALAGDYHWEQVNYVEAVKLALASGLSAYDASHLWLAWRLQVPLGTFDRRLAVEAARLGLS